MPNHSWLRSLRPYAALAALASFGGFNSASANLLLDSSSGVVRISGSTNSISGDDRAYLSSYELRGGFFGSQPIAPWVTISVNGNLFFGNGDGNGDYAVQHLGFEDVEGAEGVDRVAPMWGDFKLGDNGKVIETIADDYYMVTWLGLEGEYGEAGTLDLQAIFIEADTTLRGTNFLKGDILFSYGEINLYSTMSEVMVGLGSMFGTNATLPGHEPFNGWHNYGIFGALPVTTEQYIQFRANGEGGYDVSIETLIPEPATYALLAAVACLGLALRSHRSRKA